MKELFGKSLCMQWFVLSAAIKPFRELLLPLAKHCPLFNFFLHSQFLFYFTRAVPMSCRNVSKCHVLTMEWMT